MKAVRGWSITDMKTEVLCEMARPIATLSKTILCISLEHGKNVLLFEVSRNNGKKSTFTLWQDILELEALEILSSVNKVSFALLLFYAVINKMFLIR
jgi:hypothetical protein